jgi:Holliday junction resolvase
MARQPEGRLVHRISTWIKDKGGVVYNIHGGDNYQEEGIPDLLCCYHGRFCGIEVKMPGEEPSKAQQYQLDKIRRAGGIAFVAYSLDDVKLALMEPLGEKEEKKVQTRRR